jgi:hypothetical protein
MPKKRAHHVVVRNNGSVGLKNVNAGEKAEEANSLEAQLLSLATGGELAKAGRNAVKSQRQHGRAITFKRGTKVIKQYPDGREEVLDRVESPSYTLPQNVRIIKNQ